MGIKKLIKKIKKIKQPKVKFPKKWEIKDNEKILILSPHQDDESIGCGGLLSLYGKQCDIILLTDGRYGNPEWSEEETIKIRNLELKNAIEKCGANLIAKFNIEDSFLYKNINKTKNLKKILNNYDYVLIPNPKELHPDHMVVKDVIKYNSKLKNKFKLIYYEVWTAIQNPTHYIDISNVVQQKKELIANYKSQLKHIDYISKILGLNFYRGILFNTDYCEVFELKI